jgi:hypothetical protein
MVQIIRDCDRRAASCAIEFGNFHLKQSYPTEKLLIAKMMRCIHFMSQTDFLEYVINSIQFVFKNNQIYRGSGWFLADINGCMFCLPIDMRSKKRLPTLKTKKLRVYQVKKLKALSEKSAALLISIQTIGGLLIQPEIVLFRHHIKEP